MSSLRALYFDGRSSASGEVEIHLEAGSTIVVQGHGVNLRCPLSNVEIAPPIGNSARTIAFPDGAICELRDNEELDRLLPASFRRSRLQHVLHQFESRLTLVLAAIALAALLGWASIQYGVPYLAREIAYSVPRDVDERLGQSALEGLDQLFFARSRLDLTVQQRLRAKFAALADAAEIDGRTRLEFRASPDLGANAFALPSGIVVLTDELVTLAQSDEELLAVLAHELGHLHHRHALRGVLQSSITPVLIATVTGDVASISALAGALPTILIDMSYSRAFELEADSFAVELLAREDIPRHHLANVLHRIAGSDEDGEGLGHYLSTHPATSDRIERITGR